MRRGPKPAKSKVASKPPVGRKSPKDDARVRDLEKRLTEALKRESEALEQQTATAEILSVISSSPTDERPVFDAIARNAVTLCGGTAALVLRFDGETLRLAGHHAISPEGVERNQRAFPRRPGRDSPTGRAFLDRSVVHVPDLQAATEFVASTAPGAGSLLAVPLFREQEPIGVFGVTRGLVGPFSSQQIAMLQTFADQAVIAIENVRLFKELEVRNHDLTEALEQQTATADILRVISSSPTDLQPVLDAVVENAARLCEADDAHVLSVDGDVLRRTASYGNLHVTDTRPIKRTLVAGRAVIDRQTIHVHDYTTSMDEFPDAVGREHGFRTVLTVPLLREGTSIGVIMIRRVEVRPFSDTQITLLQTFADQAVIAIENVRLFNETKEALERQTATSEILSVISSSPTEVKPVLDAIARRSVELCDAYFANVFLVEDEMVYWRASHNVPPEANAVMQSTYPLPTNADEVIPRIIRERRMLVLEDGQRAGGTPHAIERARAIGHRSWVGVPLVREGSAIGVLAVARREVKPFSDKQIALLQTFADQAVIAIENVRLFRELEVRNRDLTEALEQQTATSDILRVISRSQMDVQPVFDTIVKSAMRLCDAVQSNLQLFEGELMHWGAQQGIGREAMDSIRQIYPMRPDRSQTASRAVLTRSVVHLPDVLDDPEYRQELALKGGWRSVLSVPMLREGGPIGAITVARPKPGTFSETQMALLQTFADQAVIAIENVRLFKELQERTAQLSRSVDELTALGQVSQALSSTLELETVLSTIVQRAIELSGADGGSVYEYDDMAEEFRLRATRNFEEELVEAARTMPLRRGEGALGLVAEQRRPIQIPDISDPAVYQSSVRETLLRTGYRAVLALPMLRDDRLVGALTIGRKSVGQFAPGVIDLLTTFANQATLAMQNARLFRELADKSRQLEAASQHKSEFLANMSHELRTPLNAIIGFSEVLSERMFGDLNEKQEEYLKDIHASGQHLLSLINDILDLSKIEAGRMELELTDFDIPTALDNALTLVRERAARRGIALQMNVDNQLGQIQADERKVRQVVLNLLSNAIKFTPEGGRIDVSAVPKDGFVEVAVRDTGVGIAPEDQEAVFEEFRQVGTADKKVEGTGLGLALSRKFVELHGGRIWVTSQVGEGSTFTFTIPVQRDE